MLRASAALVTVLLPMSMAVADQLVLRDAPNLTILRQGSANELVKAVDGSLLILGDFDHFDGIWGNGLARLDPQGNVDPNWRPGALGSITAIAGSASGEVFVATTTAASERRLRKLTTTGSPVPEWEVTFDNGLSSMAIDALGRLLVSGGFTMIGGQPRDGLAILNPQTGDVDPAEFSLPDGYVRELRRAPDGTVHLIVQQDGSAKLLRIGLDGALDPDWAATVDGSVSELAIAPNGDVFATALVSIDEIYRTQLVKVLAQSGTVDPTWDPTAGWTSGSESIYSLDVDADGSVFVTGIFDEIAGAPRPGIAKLQAQGAGANDPDWLPPAWLDHPSWSLVLNAVVHAGQLQVVGNFVVSDLASRPIAAARLDLQSGELATAQQAAKAGNVTALLRQQNGGTIIAGDFLQVDGEQRAHLARLDEDWQLDPAWNLPLAGEVHALAEDASGRVLIGGDFQVQGQPELQNLIRVNGAGTGSVDLTWLPDIDGRVNDLAIDSDGMVYLGRYLSNPSPMPGNLMRLHPDTGAVDPAWTPGVQGLVSALLLTDGFLYASSYATSGMYRVWRYPTAGPGQADPTWSTAARQSSANQMVIAEDGNLLVAGNYYVGFLASFSHVAAYPSTGAGTLQPLWEHKSAGAATGILIAPSGSIYATGWFGWDRGALIRIHADGELDNSLPMILQGAGEAMHLEADGSILVAGSPGWTQGRYRAGLAALELREDYLFADGFEP